MGVRINLLNKQFIELRDEYSAASVWQRIKNGEEFELERGNKIVINPDTVTNVHEERSSSF